MLARTSMMFSEPSPIGLVLDMIPTKLNKRGTMETGNQTQAPVGEITLATLLEVLNNVRGDIAKMDGRLSNVEGQVNSNDSTPQATFRASTSGHDHTNSPTLTPETLHQAFHSTIHQLGSNSQSSNRPFHFPLSQVASPNQSHHYQTPLNQNIPYQRPQPQPNPMNEVRNDEDQGVYEGKGE
uniref:Uncharacterized protein n=1 Tax=Solanum tuberosum TaxID=4113 RepID=M1DJ09_SOLTU